MAAAIAGAGIYFFSKIREEAKSRIDQLEAQVREKDRAAERQAEAHGAEAQRADAQRAEAARVAADAERVAKEKAEAEVRQRQEREQQARIAQEKSRADGTHKREVEVKTKPAERTAEQPPRTTATASRATVLPAAALVVTLTATMLPSQPVTMATTSAAPDPTPPKIALAVPDAERPAPVTPAAQFAIVDRAMSEGRFADAMATLKKLADASNAQAQARLGDMYAEGRGTTRDPAAAKTWYEKAALAGYTPAQMKLGAIYASSSDGARSNNLAYMWYGTAARLGATGAKAESDRIGALLQPAERAQADKAIESTVRDIRKNP